MTNIHQLETPVVLVDTEILNENIRQLHAMASQHQLAVRPHIKTHKSLEIASMQERNGISGITAAKVDEALVFIRAGYRAITLAYPVVRNDKMGRLINAVRIYKVQLNMVVDSVEGFELLKTFVERYSLRVGVFLKIDVGLHRCGLVEGDPLLVSLAGKIQACEYLHFMGLLSHAGHAYSAVDKEAVLAIAKQELLTLKNIKGELEKNGIAVPQISIGSTPTILAADSFEGVTEIRPGNYVFMDRTPLRLGLITPRQIALTVLATIVSQNDQYYIIDAGSKTLSTDMGAHGSAITADYGLAYPLDKYLDKSAEMSLLKLSEEHGFVDKTHCPDLSIGSLIRIIPNHACVITNLASEIIFTQDSVVSKRVKIDARGAVR